MTLLYVCFISDFIWSINCLLTRSLLPHATKLRQGNVFTPVCDCVHGEVSVRETPLWTETPWTEAILDRDPPLDRDPLDRHPWTATFWTETPQTEIPLDRDAPQTEMSLWTETTLDRGPPGQRPSRQRPPWTETPQIETLLDRDAPRQRPLPGQRPRTETPSEQRHPQTETPLPGRTVRSGRYASYWNAFLFHILVL